MDLERHTVVVGVDGVDLQQLGVGWELHAFGYRRMRYRELLSGTVRSYRSIVLLPPCSGTEGPYKIARSPINCLN